MASLVKDEPQVAAYFRDAVLEITDPNVLKQVIDELDEIDFRKLGPDVKGDIFEYLLTHLGQSALNGQFRTPRQIRAFMVQMTNPDLGDTVYDPACGTAGFLIDAVEHILARYSEAPEEVPIYGEDWLEKRGQTLDEARRDIPNLQTYRKGGGERLPDWGRLEASIHGTDVSRQMMRIAVMNLVLHGVRRANVKRANVLSEMSGLSEDDLHRQYQVILSNPPFAGQIPSESIRADLPTRSKKSELLFLSLMMRSLAPGGRCAVVVPEGALCSDRPRPTGTAREAAAGVRGPGGRLAAGWRVQALRRSQDVRPRLSPPPDGARGGRRSHPPRLVLRDPQRRLRPRQDPAGRTARDAGGERDPRLAGGVGRV